MTICERLFELLDKLPNKSAAGLCRKLGVNTNTTSNWKQRNTDPPAKYIVPICEYLEVSLLLLLTGSDDAISDLLESRRNMSDDEARLLSKFRELDADGQDAVRGVLLQEQRRVEAEKGLASNATA